MAAIKSVQYGTSIMTTGDTTSTATITAVDTSKSFIVLSVRVDTSDTTNPGRSCVQAVFNSSTQIGFSRQNAGGTSSATIYYYVIEYASGVTVQSGTTTNVPFTTGTNITITSVDTSKAFPIVLTKGGSSWDYGGHVTITPTITSATNLNLRSGVDSSTNTVTWQVIEHEDATVAKYENSLLNTATSVNVTITSVDLSKSFLAGNTRRNTSGGYGDTDYHWQFRLTSSTNIALQRQGASEEYYYVIYVVSLSKNCTVQRNQSTISASSTTATPTITAVTLANTFAQITGVNRHLARPDNSSANNSDNMIEIKLNSTTQVNLQRTTTGSYASYVNWEVIDLTSAATTLASMWQHYRQQRI